MTTNYTQTQTYTVPPNQLTFYSAQQQFSPVSSSSPTSPRMNDYIQHNAPNPYKQLRPLKSPLYIPAVLRPTEQHPKPSNMTPPKSLHGSLDSLNEDELDDVAQAQLNIAMENDWVEDVNLGNVTGPPTKDHWKVCVLLSTAPFQTLYPQLRSSAFTCLRPA